MTPLYRVYLGIFPAGMIIIDDTRHYKWIDFLGIECDAKFEDAAHAKRDLVGYIEDKYNFKGR